jgi:ethanolamine permease
MGKEKSTLKRKLNAFHLWGIAVGLVISGEYFGWSYGWASAGTLGFLIATLFVAIMYLTFIFSFTEMSCAIPQAGGPFAYARRAFGPLGGFFGGVSTLVEFVCAPPSIAMAIGAYFGDLFPQLSPVSIAIVAYIIFVCLNLMGVSMAATFELVVTIIAIFELLVFMGVVAPGFQLTNFLAHGWAGSDTFTWGTVSGICASIPFAIWFFLAIEGASMSAEEAKNPQVTVKKGFIWGILTLVILAVGVMMFAGGTGDWRELSNINDPLPSAMRMIVGSKSGWLHMLVSLGLFGLVASFHGIIMEASRQVFALSRAGYLPKSLSAVNKRAVPHLAIILTGVFGILCVLSDKFDLFLNGQSLTANVITLACFGSISMYVISMLALFRLRKKEPNLKRPYKAVCYPVFPIIALIGAVVCFVLMVVYNFNVFIAYLILVGLCYIYYIYNKKNIHEVVIETPEEEEEEVKK